MARQKKETFDLIPATRPQEQITAPIALLPAIPVRLGARDGLECYASVDTGAQISSMSEGLYKRLGSPAASTMEVLAVGFSESFVHRLNVDLFICRPDFIPWARIESVPILIVSSLKGHEITLGYEACLSLLRLDINYPNRTLSVSVDESRLELDRETANIPPRIQEAEALLEYESYAAAVLMFAAGLEELLVEGRTYRPLPQLLQVENPPSSLMNSTQRLWNLRNKAVHSNEPVTREDAIFARSTASRILTFLTGKRDVNQEPSTLEPSLREYELIILNLIALGYSTSEISQRMGIARTTVKAYVSSLYRKLGVKNRADAARKGFAAGLLSLEDEAHNTIA